MRAVKTCDRELIDASDPMKPYSDRLSALTNALAFLHGRGLSASDNSRAVTYRHVLEAFIKDGPLFTHFPIDEHRYVVQAVHEAGQLAVILESLGRDLDDKQLRTLFSGEVFAEPVELSANARNLQFELLMAALARRGGLKVHLAEPDVLIEHGATNLGMLIFTT